MSSSVESRTALGVSRAQRPGVTSGFVMSLTRSGQAVFVAAIAGSLLFPLVPDLAPTLAAMACFVSVLLIGIGVNTYRPKHWWPWALVAVRWITVGVVSLLTALDPSKRADLGMSIALEVTRVASIVAIAALFLYARPRRFVDVSTVFTLLFFGVASILALTPTAAAHLSTTHLVDPATKPGLFAAVALGTWFVFGFLIIRLGPVLPTALARLGLGAWLSIGLVGATAVGHVLADWTSPILANVPYMYAWMMALATASGALHPSMAHLRPTPDRVWTPVVERAAFVGAIVVAFPLAFLVPLMFTSEFVEALCYGTLAIVVMVSLARITSLSANAGRRRVLGPRSLREMVPAETRELQGLVDVVRISDLLQPDEVVVVTFTLRGLNELRLLVGTDRQLEIEDRWAASLVANLPPLVRAVRLRPGCVVALLRADQSDGQHLGAVTSLVDAVRPHLEQMTDTHVVLDIRVGASDVPNFDMPSVELAVALAESNAVALRSGMVKVASLAENQAWRVRQSTLRHLQLDADFAASLTLVGEHFVDLHTSDVVGMRVEPQFAVLNDEVVNGSELADLVSQAEVGPRFYATVLQQATSWAATSLGAGSILVVPVNTRALLDDDYLASLLHAQASARVARHELWLEIPAANLTTVPAGLADRLEFLVLQDIHLMVGGFGNEHANLATLATLPLQALALDESFVSTVGLYLRSGVLAANVASMAWDLDYTVVAGGIKYADQREELADAACKYAWGPLFGAAQVLSGTAPSHV